MIRIDTNRVPSGWPHGSRPVFIAVLIATATLCTAHDDVEIRVKAAFVYNFARFVEWPHSEDHRPITIAVIGENELRSTLEQTVRGKMANGRRIEVRALSSLNGSERFEILFIERSEMRKVKDIAQSIAGKPVLTVCDFDNCLHDGGMIVFRVVDETVRFEVNLEAAERAGLKISSQLLKVALPAGRRK